MKHFILGLVASSLLATSAIAQPQRYHPEEIKYEGKWGWQWAMPESFVEGLGLPNNPQTRRYSEVANIYWGKDEIPVKSDKV
jgi:hypothetical protein